MEIPFINFTGVIAWRGFNFLFIKHWYSLHRWNNPSNYEGHIFKLIDIGAFTIGYYYEQ